MLPWRGMLTEALEGIMVAFGRTRRILCYPLTTTRTKSLSVLLLVLKSSLVVFHPFLFSFLSKEEVRQRQLRVHLSLSVSFKRSGESSEGSHIKSSNNKIRRIYANSSQEKKIFLILSAH